MQIKINHVKSATQFKWKTNSLGGKIIMIIISAYNNLVAKMCTPLNEYLVKASFSYNTALNLPILHILAILFFLAKMLQIYQIERRSPMCNFKTSHRFLIEFRSGLLLGHSKTLIIFWTHSLIDLDLCHVVVMVEGEIFLHHLLCYSPEACRFCANIFLLRTIYDSSRTSVPDEAP